MVICDLRSLHAGTFPVSAHHFSRHDCASRTLSNRTGSNRQGKAFTGDCGGSKYSRSRIAPIELMLSCLASTETMFLLMSGSPSIEVVFASATVLNAESNAATIKGFIGLASLPNARACALNLSPLPFRGLVGPRGDGRYRVLASARRFSDRARRIAGENLRRLLHLLAELFRLVRNHLRLPRHELALALREFLRFLGARHFLAELHRVRQSLVRQRCHLLAGGDGLGLEIFGHLARHAQEAVNGLSALIETLLRELPAPDHSEICRLHRAFAALLREICRISCHRSSPGGYCSRLGVFPLCRIHDSSYGATGPLTPCSWNFKKKREHQNHRVFGNGKVRKKSRVS